MEIARPVSVGVPAYFGPWEQQHWRRLMSDVPSVVVLNPANGPGTAPSRDYRALRETLRGLRIRVLMYVHTAYLTRSPMEMAVDVERSHSWFDVEGVFFDEVPVENTRAIRSKLDRLRDLSPAPCTFNAGRVVPESWYSRYPAASFVTFEGTPGQLAERSSTVGSPVVQGPTNRQWWLLHSAPLHTHRQCWDTFRDLGLELGYVTNDRLPNPWDVYVSPRRR
jgi:Spherulation-specific family 4